MLAALLALPCERSSELAQSLAYAAQAVPSLLCQLGKWQEGAAGCSGAWVTSQWRPICDFLLGWAPRALHATLGGAEIQVVLPAWQYYLDLCKYLVDLAHLLVAYGAGG